MHKSNSTANSEERGDESKTRDYIRVVVIYTENRRNLQVKTGLKKVDNR